MMKLTDLKESLNLKLINGNIEDIDFDGVYAGDFLSRAMSHVSSGNLWVTIMTNTNVIAVASLSDCAAVILAEGMSLMPDALKAAEDNDIIVLSSEDTVYDICVKIYKTLNENE